MNWVTRAINLVVWVVIVVPAWIVFVRTRVGGRLVSERLQAFLLYYHRLDTVLKGCGHIKINTAVVD